MQLIRHLPLTHDRPTAVAIGNFDGLHLGHRAVIEAMQAAAKARGAVPSVLTFEPHPRRLFAPSAPSFRLESLAVKLARLRAAGVERCYMPRFDAAFAGLSADRFLEEVLKQSLGACAVVTGENFAFGHKRGGDVHYLCRWGVAEGVAISTVPPVVQAGEICSSSAVRAAVMGGDMAQSARLLGREYTLAGRVVHGDARGREMGYPTANLALSPGLVRPAYGIYAVWVRVDGEVYPGAASFGVRPTVYAAGAELFEVHLLDTARDLYGKKLEVALVARLRGEEKFDSLEALIAQIDVDCMEAKRVLGI